MKKTVEVGILARIWIPAMLKSQRSDAGKRRLKSDLRDVFKVGKDEMEELGMREISLTEKAARGLKAADGVVEWPEEVNGMRWTRELSRAESDVLHELLRTFEAYDLDDVWQDDLLAQLDRKAA